jgi:calcineurin-like phosphoesterase family protein
MKRYLIADTHFDHSNVIKYENRPFQNIHDMNESIIMNWQKTVKKNDMIYILGDFAFGNKERIKYFVSRLPGRKFLILGNHDNHSVKFYHDVGFEFVSKWPIIIDQFFILSHEPMYMNDSMPYLNIHGHIHSKKMTGNYYNVSVEQINYTPINFDLIKKWSLLK